MYIQICMHMKKRESKIISFFPWFTYFLHVTSKPVVSNNIIQAAYVILNFPLATLKEKYKKKQEKLIYISFNPIYLKYRFNM